MIARFLLAALAAFGLFVSAGPARAVTDLPPDMVIPNTSPQMVIPGIAVLELHEAAKKCEAKFGKFSYDTNNFYTLDFTGDGGMDYILSTGGFLCDGKHHMFADTAGDLYYLFISGPRGLAKYAEPVQAFELEVEAGLNPPQLVFTQPCIGGGITAVGKTTMVWRKRGLDIVSNRIGCGLMTEKKQDNTPPPLLQQSQKTLSGNTVQKKALSVEKSGLGAR
jgi:hypothetical protein